MKFAWFLLKLCRSERQDVRSHSRRNNNDNNNENFIKWIFSLYIQLQISLISGNLQLAT
jgi:hypothetical protein